MQPLSRLALVVALAVAIPIAAGEVRPAFAQDGGDGGKEGGKEGGKDGEKEGGEHGGDGAEGGMEGPPPAEAPSLADGGTEIGDPKKWISIRVPRSWKRVDTFEPTAEHLVLYRGPITTTAPAAIVLGMRRTCSRATLALGTRFGSESIAAEARSGDGWAETGGIMDTGRGFRVMVWSRAIEKDGHVFFAELNTPEQGKDEARDLARKILESLKVTGGPPKPTPPAGIAPSRAGEFDVWADDKKAGAGAAELAGEGRSYLAKQFKTKAFDDTRPLLEAYSDGSVYVERAKATFGDPPDFGFVDSTTRSVLVQIYKSKDDDFPVHMRQCGARQFLIQYFGGVPPTWVDWGLRWYAGFVAEAGGKPDKISAARSSPAQQVAASTKRRLDEWMDESGLGTDELDPKEDKSAAGGYELFAWHHFLRSSAGKKYSKNYQGYLDTLRTSGDPAAARKAWDGVDFAAMLVEFKDYWAKWK